MNITVSILAEMPEELHESLQSYQLIPIGIKTE